MNNNTSYNLRLKVLIGMSLFIFLVIGSSIYQLKTLSLSEQNHSLYGELSQLKDISLAITRSSANYTENAPRDFKSYQRDVKVFHKDVLGDVEQFNQKLTSLADDINNKLGFALPPLIGDQLSDKGSYAMLNESVNRSLSNWKTFKSEFEEQLGDNKNEPRLEWGANYIQENSPNLNESIRVMVMYYQNFLEQQSFYAHSIANSSLALMVIIGILGLIWFYQRVIKRIGRTVDACEQVASGDFGYTLPIEGNDEITVLSHAFNALSSRSKLVLAMLDELQKTDTINEALNIITQAAGGYLPIAWAGFMETSPDNNAINLQHTLPVQMIHKWSHRSLDLEQGFGLQIASSLINKQPVMINKLREFAVQNPEERLLRELVRNSQVESLVALPLTSSNGWEGVLLFASRTGEYRRDQTELLEHLSNLMANNFERMNRAQENATLLKTQQTMLLKN